MSHPHFPQEITDYIIDLLQNERGTLEQCCLVSKSWVPRTRKHLFGTIKFPSSDALGAWIRMFPDSSNSPSTYVQSLRIACVKEACLEIIAGSEWIQSFANVVRLAIRICMDQPTFSPTQIFKIVCSLPLLQDLDIMSRGIPNNDRSVIFQPAVSPPLTGTFSICLAQGIGQTMRVLLDLPNSVRFRKLLGTARLEEDLWWIAALVAVCSDTLEYIYVRCLQPRPRPSLEASIPLSGATNVKEVVFWLSVHYVEWATTGLKTITSKHKDLRLVLLVISFPSSLVDEHFEEGVYTQWMDLDRTLVRLQKSCPLHTELHYYYTAGGDAEAGERVRELLGNLLPESTKTGAVELVHSVG